MVHGNMANELDSRGLTHIPRGAHSFSPRCTVPAARKCRQPLSHLRQRLVIESWSRIAPAPPDWQLELPEIGRASCRDRVSRYIGDWSSTCALPISWCMATWRTNWIRVV